MENYGQVNISKFLCLMLKSQLNKNFGAISYGFDGTIVDNCTLIFQPDR